LPDHGIEKLITYDPDDFQIFGDINLINPIQQSDQSIERLVL